MPHSFDGVQGAAIRWEEHLFDPIIEMILDYPCIVHTKIIHIYIGITFDLLNQLRDECGERLGVVALLKNAIMNETKLLTDSTHYCHSSTTTIGLAQGHIFLQPYSFTYKLFVKLTFIDVDYLLPCHHLLSNLHHCHLLIVAYLLLSKHLSAVRILRLHISNLVPLIEL